MLVRLRRGYGNLVTSGAQLVLIVIGLQTESALGMAACVALMAPISLVAWISAWRRARAIDDTPTSRIASAAQGYAELIGSGKNQRRMDEVADAEAFTTAALRLQTGDLIPIKEWHGLPQHVIPTTVTTHKTRWHEHQGSKSMIPQYRPSHLAKVAKAVVKGDRHPGG